MNIINIMRENNMLGWSTLRYGFIKYWITSKDVINFAVKQLTNSEGNDYNLSLLASSENDSTDSILKMIDQYIESKKILIDENLDYKKWLLATLLNIQNLDMSEQEKINELQRVYADFNYPVEMKKCSIYYYEDHKKKGQKKIHIDPLEEMKKVINILSNEIF